MEFQREFPRLRVLGFRAEVQLLEPSLRELEFRRHHGDHGDEKDPGHPAEGQSRLRVVPELLGDADKGGA